MKIFEQLESEVRGYCRSFPVVFNKAEGSYITDRDGKSYLDFFAGAGALNYGHNHPRLKEALVDYIASSGVVHSLDLMTDAKEAFLVNFDERILQKRGLRYKMQFPGPTGTNSVEAAIKLARKVTGRQTVVSFTNAFHGMTLGSLALTGNRKKRAGAGVPLGHSMPMPFDGYLGENFNTIEVLERYLEDTSSGLDLPAAIIVETIQAEGGINVASPIWLNQLAWTAKKHGIVLIVDDIQVGCGRTGSFFSFEQAGITPDIVCLSKSLSGYGLPFALTLIRPELDNWAPGEHNGTFRGHNLAFVTANASMEFWHDHTFQKEVEAKSAMVRQRLEAIERRFDDAVVSVRGRGMIQGLELRSDLASQTSKHAFERGLIIETAGRQDEVLKLLPPLTLSESELAQGLEIIENALETSCKTWRKSHPPASLPSIEA